MHCLKNKLDTFWSKLSYIIGPTVIVQLEEMLAFARYWKLFTTYQHRNAFNYVDHHNRLASINIS